MTAISIDRVNGRSMEITCFQPNPEMFSPAMPTLRSHLPRRATGSYESPSVAVVEQAPEVDLQLVLLLLLAGLLWLTMLSSIFLQLSGADPGVESTYWWTKKKRAREVD